MIWFKDSLVIAGGAFFRICGSYVRSLALLTKAPAELVWPGDADNSSMADNDDLLPVGLHYGESGTPRDSTDNTWLAHTSIPWSGNQANGWNKKYADCNGDGIINDADTLAIALNYGFTHSLFRYASPLSTASALPALKLIPSDTATGPGDFLDVDVVLGDSLNTCPELYGIAFDISYDNVLAEAGSESMDYTGSWLGTQGIDAITLSHFGSTADGVITRTDHLPVNNGYGKIARFRFRVNTSINTVSTFTLSFSSFLAVDEEGNVLAFQPGPCTVQIDPALSTGEQTGGTASAALFPNPAPGNFILEFNAEKSDPALISIFDLASQVVYKKTVTSTIGKNRLLINTGLPAGVYCVKITSDAMQKTIKLILN